MLRQKDQGLGKDWTITGFDGASDLLFAWARRNRPDRDLISAGMGRQASLAQFPRLGRTGVIALQVCRPARARWQDMAQPTGRGVGRLLRGPATRDHGQ
ncbi:MAG: hypothetical protein JJT99_00815 [Rhodobacteraceae bacterium]|nr:hypothetical protein [Paracoccaceae bacterium]